MECACGNSRDDFSAPYDFPAHVGRNLDALCECVGDVASGGYDLRQDSTGLVIVMRAYETFAAVDRSIAQRGLLHG